MSELSKLPCEDISVKVLALIGSPRKQSNTDIVASEILEGALAGGHQTEKVYLYEQNIAPCVDCQACKKSPFRCAIQDDIQKLLPKIAEADILIFGTPLYWYGPSAKMKLLVDRFRPFIASKGLKRKKAVLVIPSEEGADACNHAVGMFALSFEYLGIDLIGKMLPQASKKAEVKAQPKVLKEAFEIGKSL